MTISKRLFNTFDTAPKPFRTLPSFFTGSNVSRIFRVGLTFLFNSRYSKIIAAGVLLRFLLMPFTIQGDIMEHTWIASFVAQGHIDVYRYYFERFGTITFPPGTNVGIPAAGFPPLFYLLEATYLVVLRRLNILGFIDFQPNMRLLWSFPIDGRIFFFVKVLYLPFDFLGLIVFLKCLEKKNRVAGAAAWMLNPFLLYITYGWGQADIIAASLTMVAIYAAKVGLAEKRLDCSMLSCLALGLAASFKLFALALLPIFAFFLSKKSLRHWLLEIGVGLSPLLVIIPFLSKQFLGMMQYYGQYLLSRNLSASSSDFTIYIIPALYLVLIYQVYFGMEKHDFPKLTAAGLTVFSLLYGLAVWLPNWILWGLPFILLAIFERPKSFWIYGLISVFYFLFVQSWGNSLWIGLFFPLTDATFGSGPTLTLPPISRLIPFPGQVIVGSSYTVIGVSVFFLAYMLWKPGGISNNIQQALRWAALLLLPVSLATVNLILGAAHFQTSSGLILATLTTRISADLAFFIPYFLLLAGALAWLLISSAKSYPSSVTTTAEEGAIGVGKS